MRGVPSEPIGPDTYMVSRQAAMGFSGFGDLNAEVFREANATADIGEAYSEKIIKGWPYQRKDELVQKKVLPQATYEQIKYKIVAKQR